MAEKNDEQRAHNTRRRVVVTENAEYVFGATLEEILSCDLCDEMARENAALRRPQNSDH